MNLLILSMGALLLLFQNCSGEMLAIDHLPTSGLPSLDGSGAQMYNSMGPNLLDDCMTNSNFNTCIFYKNPVAQNGAALASPVAANTNLSSLQIHAVNIFPAQLDGTGYLQNRSFYVEALNSDGSQLPRVNARRNVYKYPYGQDGPHYFSQVMAFYWLNFQIEFMQTHTGNFYAKNRNIRVISYIPNPADDPRLANAYWSYQVKDRRIFIGSTGTGNELALGAEVYLHEMGHANLGYATGFTHYETSGPQSKSQTCSDGMNNCCKTPLGCAAALDEGQADYHMAIIFSENTAFMESYENRVEGIAECGITRKINLNSTLTINQAYDACRSVNPSRDAQGEVHLMGRVYASIWWEVRKRAALVGVDEVKDLDTLFTEHLQSVQASDDYSTMLIKIKAIDAMNFGGRFSNLFQTQFENHGITAPIQ